MSWNSWMRPTTDGPLSDGWEAFRWTFIVPSGETSFEIPELPAELAEFAPNPADSVDGGVSLIESSDIAERLHEVPLWHATCPECDRNRPDFPRVMVSH